MGKTTEREENSTIKMVVTGGFSSVLVFLDSDRDPPPRWEGSVIYTGNMYRIK